MTTRVGLSIIEGAYPGWALHGAYNTAWTPEELLDVIDAYAAEVSAATGAAIEDSYPAAFSLWVNLSDVTSHSVQPSEFPSEVVMDGLRERGVVPFINITAESDLHSAWKNHIDGTNDGIWDTFAEAALAWANNAESTGLTLAGEAKSSRIIIRPFFEMNGAWFPWAAGKPVAYAAGDRNTVDGATNGFIAAWRHIFGRIRHVVRASNVEFHWCTSGGGGLAYFPGDDYVHYVGSDFYNFNPGILSTPSLWSKVQTHIAALAATTTKPYIVGEFAHNRTNADGVATPGSTGNQAARVTYYTAAVNNLADNDVYAAMLFDINVDIINEPDRDFTLGAYDWADYSAYSASPVFDAFWTADQTKGHTRFPVMAAPEVPRPFLFDTFEDDSGTALPSHLGDFGHTWSKHPLVTPGSASVGASDRAYHDTKAWPNAVVYLSGSTPDTADYTVTAAVRAVGSMEAGQTFSLYGRCSSTVKTYYEVRLSRYWDFSGGGPWLWSLFRVLAGSYTLLDDGVVTVGGDSFAHTTAAPHDLTLKMLGTSISVLFDDEVQTTVVDANITAKGKVGIGWEHSGGQSTAAKNISLASIQADTLTAPSSGTGVGETPTAAWAAVAASGAISQAGTGIGTTATAAWAAVAASGFGGGAGVGIIYDYPDATYDDPLYTYDGEFLGSEPIYGVAETATAVWAALDSTGTGAVGATGVGETPSAVWAALDASGSAATIAIADTATAAWEAEDATGVGAVGVVGIAETAESVWAAVDAQGFAENGLRNLKGYTIQLQRLVDDDDPMWRSPIWEKKVYPAPLRLTRTGAGEEVIANVDASLEVTEPLLVAQAARGWAGAAANPYRPNDAGDCAPCCCIAAMYMTSQGAIPNRRMGIPAGGDYNLDTDRLKENRATLIEDIRRKGGAPAKGGVTASEAMKGYKAQEPLFRQFDRSRPRATLIDGGPGTWREMADAIRAGLPVMVNLDYGPIDWYPATSATGGESYPNRHLVSGQWGYDEGHSILVYETFRQDGEEWWRYMDPLADGRDNASPRRMAKGVQAVPMRVIRAGVRRRQGNDDEADGIIFRWTWATDVVTPEPDAFTSGDLETVYDGPRLPNGTYTVRYQIESVAGDKSTWAYDHGLEVTGEEDDVVLPEQDYGARTSEVELKLRVVLREMEDPYHDEVDEEEPEPEEPVIKVGYFYPPFPEGKAYRTTTYAGHSDFSTDFNRGNAGDDEGDWVLAIASGTVRHKDFRAPGTNSPGDDGKSDLLIEHAGRYQSLYTHMKDIQVNEGATVRLGQRLGRISLIGEATGSHLHHKHLRRDEGDASTFGRPIKMKFQGVAMIASVEDSDTRPAGWGVTGQVVVGQSLPRTDGEPTDPVVDPEYSRAPGDVVAVIEDGLNWGVSEYANAAGEWFVSLPLTHPQLTEVRPFLTHYDFQQFRGGAWVTLSEGLLRDADIGPNDVVVYGTDTMGMLGLSVETAKQPDSNADAEIDADEGPTGSKYVDKTINYIIENQLERAIADEDSPVGWVEMGVVQAMPESQTTIYAAFANRLELIRGLLDSYRAGQGRRPRVVARRDPTDGNKMKFDVLEDAGVDRPEMRLEYGSLIQGFDLIPFGDFAVKVHGVGHRPLSAKPFYAMKKASGVSTQLWGNIGKAKVYLDIDDQTDLARRVLEDAQSASRIGKRIALGIRVRGLDPKDGWDVMDNIPLAIDRGPLRTRFWTPDGEGSRALSWWTIWGYEWRVTTDETGTHDDLTLIVLPRVDSGKPLEDTGYRLFHREDVHLGDSEWSVPNVDPDDPDNPDPDPEPEPSEPMLIGVDFANPYQSELTMGQLKNDGVDFAIGKISQGTYFPYSTVKDKVVRAKAIGLVGGFYHFLTRVRHPVTGVVVDFNTGDKQCDYFISQMPKDADGRPDPEGYLVAVDFENNNGAQSFTRNGTEYFPDEGGATWVELRAFINRWFERFPTHPLLVYSSVGEAPAGKDIKALNPKVFCWNAYWADRDDTPLYANNWTEAAVNSLAASLPGDQPWKPGWGGFYGTVIWQISSDMKIHGYTGMVDGDAFRGTKAQLLNYAVSADTDPDPDPEPTDREEFVAGYNAVLAAARTAVPAIDPDTGTTAYETGEQAARDAIVGAIPTNLTE